GGPTRRNGPRVARSGVVGTAGVATRGRGSGEQPMKVPSRPRVRGARRTTRRAPGRGRTGGVPPSWSARRAARPGRGSCSAAGGSGQGGRGGARQGRQPAHERGGGRRRLRRRTWSSQQATTTPR